MMNELPFSGGGGCFRIGFLRCTYTNPYFFGQVIISILLVKIQNDSLNPRCFVLKTLGSLRELEFSAGHDQFPFNTSIR